MDRMDNCNRAMTVLAYICWSHAVILQPGKADAIIVLGYVSKTAE